MVGDEAGEDVVAAMAEGAEGGDNRGSSIHNENRALQEPPRWKFNVNVKNQLTVNKKAQTWTVL